LLGNQPGRRYEFEDATGWETQPGMVQKLVEIGVRCQALLGGARNRQAGSCIG
jgi:hypothetical protein